MPRAPPPSCWPACRHRSAPPRHDAGDGQRPRRARPLPGPVRRRRHHPRRAARRLRQRRPRPAPPAAPSDAKSSRTTRRGGPPSPSGATTSAPCSPARRSPTISWGAETPGSVEALGLGRGPLVVRRAILRACPRGRDRGDEFEPACECHRLAVMVDDASFDRVAGAPNLELEGSPPPLIAGPGRMEPTDSSSRANGRYRARPRSTPSPPTGRPRGAGRLRGRAGHHDNPNPSVRTPRNSPDPSVALAVPGNAWPPLRSACAARSHHEREQWTVSDPATRCQGG